jgi:hypothetical protein
MKIVLKLLFLVIFLGFLVYYLYTTPYSRAPMIQVEYIEMDLTSEEEKRLF